MMATNDGNRAAESTRVKTVHWYANRLPVDPYPTRIRGVSMVTGDTEEGFDLFVRTHTKAYGGWAERETYETYRLEVEEGVVDPDKMITVLQGDHPLGCLSYEVLQKPDGFKFLLLHNLGVDLDHRGRGFGEEILKIVMNMLTDDFGSGLMVLAEIGPGEEVSGHILEKSGFQRVEPQDWFPSSPGK